MGTWTNKHNLPDRIIRVIKGKYKTDKKPELNRLSITDLPDDPLQRLLYIHHWDEWVRDYSDLLTMTQGNALHDRYEMCALDDDDVEHKLMDAVSEIIVVGKADNYFNDIILDVKQTGVYGPKYRLPKWEKQLNCYAWQRYKRKQGVNYLLVDVWYRDWKQGNIHWKDYPSIPYECIGLDLWDFETQDKYIRNQVQKHLSHPVFDKLEEYQQLEPCSDEQRGIRFEAYKGKNKTPTKVGTLNEVTQWCQQQPQQFDIRKSEPVFCNRYCKARSICPFAAKPTCKAKGE